MLSGSVRPPRWVGAAVVGQQLPLQTTMLNRLTENTQSLPAAPNVRDPYAVRQVSLNMFNELLQPTFLPCDKSCESCTK